MWGVPGDPDEPITMTRYYAAQRTFWVDPVSGTIVKTNEHGYHYYAREPLKPEVTFVDYTVTSNEETVESQVASGARRAGQGRAVGPHPADHVHRDRPGRCWSVARCSGSFSLRAESALIDPGLDEADHGFFDTQGIKVPGAEAKTEKLPTARAAATCPGQTGLIARCERSQCRLASSRRPTRWCSPWR